MFRIRGIRASVNGTKISDDHALRAHRERGHSLSLPCFDERVRDVAHRLAAVEPGHDRVLRRLLTFKSDLSKLN